MRKIILSLTTFVSVAASAQTLQLGIPAYGGTGCPAGSASVTLSPDQSSLSILFDSYVVQAGTDTGKRIDRKSCNVAIPVTVPQGYSVAVFQVDYRGFNALPVGGRAQFNVEYFLAGRRGPGYAKNWYGPLTDNYTLTDTLLAEAVVWSACGAQVTLRSNSSFLTMTNNRNEQAMGTVDSADVTAGLIYHLAWRRCN